MPLVYGRKIRMVSHWKRSMTNLVFAENVKYIH